MEITLSLKDLLIFLICTGVIVFLGYLVILMKNLVKTVKVTNKILEDTKVVSEIAAKKAVEVDGMVDDVADTVSHFSEMLKGTQSIVSAVSNIVNALGSLSNLIKKNDIKGCTKKS